MSADDVVYIIMTSSRDTGETEYRVGYEGTYGHIFDEPDYPPRDPQLNRRAVRKTFGRSRVLVRHDYAYGYALCVIDRTKLPAVYSPEYGIEVLDFRHIHYPGKRPRKNVSRRRRRQKKRPAPAGAM